MPSTATVIIESFKDTAHIYRLAEYVNSGVITQGGLIVVDASAGAVTLDLPHTAAIDGRQFIIKKVDSTANTVTIRPSQTVGNDDIEGASSIVLSGQWDVATLIAYARGETWVIEAIVANTIGGVGNVSYSNPISLHALDRDVDIAGDDAAARRVTIGDYGNSFLDVLEIQANVTSPSAISNFNEAFGLDALLSIASGAFANTAFGNRALDNLEGGGTNVGLGYRAGDGIVDSDSNMCIGYRTCSRGDVSNCVMVGTFAGRELTGNDNVGIGTNACKGDNTVGGSGTDNMAIGNDTLDRFTTASRNTAIGNTALRELTTGTNNVGIGGGAGESLATGSSNTFVGYNAGRDVTGSSNVFIGQGVGNTATAVSNQLRIHNAGGTSTVLIFGNFSTGQLSINNNTVSEKLNVTVDDGDAMECLSLDQDDNSEGFINFKATAAANTTNPITTFTAGNSIQGFVRIEINGVDRWLPFYDAPTS